MNKTWDFNKAAEMLRLGYRMEVLFDPKARRLKARIIHADGRVAGVIRRPVFEQVRERVPLSLIHGEWNRGIYSYDFSFSEEE